MKLTPADMLVLHMLLWQCSVARHGTLAAVYRLGGLVHPSAINRRVRELVASDLVQHAKVACRPLLELDAPLYACNPAEERYDYGRAGELAWKLEKRWKNLPMEPECVYYAGKKAIALFGGVMKGAVKQYAHLSHDAQCAWLYARYLEANPALARTIVSEHANLDAIKFQKVPDFVCHDSANRPVLALEVGGFYPAEKLTALFRDLERRGLALELW